MSEEVKKYSEALSADMEKMPAPVCRVSEMVISAFSQGYDLGNANKPTEKKEGD